MNSGKAPKSPHKIGRVSVIKRSGMESPVRASSAAINMSGAF
jgi:hypothetical protein